MAFRKVHNEAERFWSFVIPEPNSGCWLWLGGCEQGGYGIFHTGSRGRDRRSRRTHRYSWEMHVGQIPVGMMVLHACDVRCCVNPKHLFLGSGADNVADMVWKKRQSRGERHGRARLTEEEVHLVRELRRTGRSMSAIARCFEVGYSTISSIISGQNWRG